MHDPIESAKSTTSNVPHGSHAGVEPVAEIARRFDARAAGYDDSAFHRALAADVVGFAGLERVGRVLDVATGTGLVLRAVAEQASLARSSVSLTGIDVSQGMLDVARANLPGADLQLLDATEDLPFENGAFDLITCVTALHLMPDPAGALRGWRRVLSVGGRAVVAVFRTDAVEEVPEIAQALRRNGGRATHSTHDHLHARTGTPSALATIATEAGYALTGSRTWMAPESLEVCLIAQLEPRD